MSHLSAWTPFVSLGLFGVLGAWVYRNRRADPWSLLGVAAIIARLWTYHRMYDDLLILLALIALLRHLRKRILTDGMQVLGGCILGLTWLTLQMPANTVNAPLPWNLLYELGLPLIWGAMLCYVVYTLRCKQAPLDILHRPAR